MFVSEGVIIHLVAFPATIDKADARVALFVVQGLLECGGLTAAAVHSKNSCAKAYQSNRLQHVKVSSEIQAVPSSLQPFPDPWGGPARSAVPSPSLCIGLPRLASAKGFLEDASRLRSGSGTATTAAATPCIRLHTTSEWHKRGVRHKAPTWWGCYTFPKSQMRQVR